MLRCYGNDIELTVPVNVIIKLVYIVKVVIILAEVRRPMSDRLRYSTGGNFEGNAR